MQLNYLGHVGKPLEKSEDSFEVITDCAVGHTIVVHDLNSTKLVVRRVHFSAQNLLLEKDICGFYSLRLAYIQLWLLKHIQFKGKNKTFVF